MTTFNHQIKHLQGVIERTKRTIDENVVTITRNNALSDTLRSNNIEHQKFIEETEAAIRLLEGAFDAKNS